MDPMSDTLTADPPEPSLTDAVEKVDLNQEENAMQVEKEDDDTPNVQESSSTEEDNDENASTDDDSDDAPMDPAKADACLLEAMTLKEEGNDFFKKAELERAAQSYRKGCNRLKPLNKNNTGDAQVKALLLTLHTNLSMVCFKQSKHKLSVDVATKALTLDPTHVKALYRRALAQRQMGNVEQAKSDLRQALKTEPTNGACKKELAAIKKAEQVATATQKKALAKAFGSSSSTNSFSLYDDKQVDEEKRQQEELKKKKEQEELQKKRKAEWEDECVKRMANNEGAISFEEWETEQAEAAKKQKEEADRTKKEEEKKRKEERKRLKKEKKEQVKEDSDDELTESELAMMRGYKKTADGRTTSYFTRELSEEEKKALGNTAPKRLDDQNGPTLLSSASLLDPASSGTSHSAWNQAGTWEEKDTTTWCTSQLTKRLEETTLTANKLDADITKVHEVVGDASVAMAGGKKRYLFDYHAKLDYEIKDNEGTSVASGTVRLPDICSTSHEELEVAFETWTKKPCGDHETEALQVRAALASQIRANVQVWVQDFNSMY